MLHAPWFGSRKSGISYRKPRSRESDRRRRRQAQAFCAEVLEPRMLLATFLVSSANDHGIGSLRQAILDANSTPGPNTIDFGIATGPQSIALASNLPTITQSLTIDATTQPGYPGSPIIELRGDAIGPAGAGLEFNNAPSSVVKGLALNRFAIEAIGIYGGGSSLIANDFVGTDLSGTLALPNGRGINIVNSPSNTVGGTTVFALNVISGNSGDGIDIFGSAGTVVAGNRIGTNAAGNAPLGNESGVVLSASSRNTVGGAAGGARNLISGNRVDGVVIGSSSPNNVVAGNTIGTDLDGTVPLGNGLDGVLIVSANNTVGGAEAGAGNLVSGNVRVGIYLLGTGATGNLIQGNDVGTDLHGAAALGNGNHGVVLQGGASNNTIGGLASGAGNLISGNAISGVDLVDPSTTGNLVEGNKVGTNAAGTMAIANHYDGVDIGAAVGNTVGGTAPGAGNLISGNAVDGVSIFTSAMNNVVQGNLIGTEVTGLAMLANGLDGVFINSASNTVGGTAAGAGNVVSGNARLGIYLLGSGATGNLIAGNKVGTIVSGAAPLGNGLSGIELQNGASNNTVGGTAAGASNLISGNLLEGLVLTNACNSNLIAGNFIGTNAAGTMAVRNIDDAIYIDSASNTIVNNLISGNGRAGLYFHGPGAMGNLIQANTIGTDPTGELILGNGNRGILLEAGASNNTIGGTIAGAGNLISGNGAPAGWAGLEIADAGSTGNLVEGNKIGTDATGLGAIGNNGDGVQIFGASGNTIGGSIPGAGNLISGNGGRGVFVLTNSAGNLVQGNKIGTDVNGTKALGNALQGVEVWGNANTVGGTTIAARNVISGNGLRGVLLAQGAMGDLIEGNFVGTNADGTAALGNGWQGVEIWTSGNTVGGTSAGAGNLISGNGNRGVLLINGANNNLVLGNLIGTDFTGIAAIPNAWQGVEIWGNANTVGGTTNAAGNVISGNGLRGVLLVQGATGNLIEGNFIGTSVTGTTALANGSNGVEVWTSGNTIGGTAPGAGNVIAFNNANGVVIGATATATAAGNAILGNSIFANAGIGIDLGNDGVTPNDSQGHTGPNLFQDFPALSLAASSFTGTTVSGTVHGPTSSTLRIEVFSNPAPDPSGHGQGQTFLGAIAVTTDAFGNGAFTFTSTVVVTPGRVLSATATDAGGNTSEFSRHVTVASDVTSRVSTSRLGPVRIPGTPLYLGTLTIANTSNASIAGGLDVVLAGLTPGVTLEAAVIVVGTSVYRLTVSVSPAGDPVIHIPRIVLAALMPGHSFTLILAFTNPARALINYIPKVFSNP